MKDEFIIGLGSNATCGKDTLFGLIKEIVGENKVERVALADLLKAEVNEITQKLYGISAFTKDPAEKELIRPLFVAHGKIRRIQTKGTYFTSAAQERIDSHKFEGIISIITDIRYNIYENDELWWLKNKNNGIYIQVNRFLNGSKISPANEDEKQNEQLLAPHADFTLNWPTSSDKEYLKDIILTQLGPVIDRINSANS